MSEASLPALPEDAEVSRRVLAIVAANKHLPVEAVSADRSFEELGVDSLDRLNILFDLEKEFGIEINDDDARHVTNLREMTAGVSLLLTQKNGAAGGDPRAVDPSPVGTPRP